MAEALTQGKDDVLIYTPSSPITEGQIVQLGDGSAGFAEDDIASGVKGVIRVRGVARITKKSGVVFLDGAPVYWDHSANEATYKPVNDRDFLMGVAVGDWPSSGTVMDVRLNVEPQYLISLKRGDFFNTTIVGTQGLNTMGVFARGGGRKFLLSSTSEAQKMDVISSAGFSKDANAIVDFVFNVVSDGAGSAVDVSIGVANATHATDADSIAESVFAHLDANNTNINLESDDGTTEVAATDSTYDYTEGAGVANLVYVTMDFRDPADVQIYINGVLALPSTVFNVNAATGPFLLICHIEKTSAADTYELDLHEICVRIME